jgi:hypothetical protein
MKFNKTHALQSFTLILMKFYRQSYETPYEAVNRVLKQTQLNSKDAILVIYDKEFSIKQTDTHETLKPVMREIFLMSRLQKLKDKGLKD